MMYQTYSFFVRAKNKAFSLFLRNSFCNFGIKSVVESPLRLLNPQYISVGSGVYICANSWLQVINTKKNDGSARIIIGDGTSIAGNCVISAAQMVVLEEYVLIARNVYISDHSHRCDQRDVPILQQGITSVHPVRIGRGAWIGQNAVICPGVTIGVGAVVGANSVVKQNVPDYALAVGAPAIIKHLPK